MSFGQAFAVCEYCGTQVKQILTEGEINKVAKDKGFVDAITAAVHCIESKDYKKAISLADKAEEMDASDPAPAMIRFIAYLPTDFKKAASNYKIAGSLGRAKESAALTNDQFMLALGILCRNYLDDRDMDIRRTVTTMGRIGPQDIENIRVYEYRKRGEDYETIPELKEAMVRTAEDCLKECEDSMPSIGQMDQVGWKKLMDARRNTLYRTVTILFMDRSLASRSESCIRKYDTAISMKWESMARSIPDIDKRALKNYRIEADACMNWVSRYC